MEVKGKICIVTGSAQGLGKEFATRLLKAGASVTISDLKEDIGKKTVGDLQRKFGRESVNFLVCDVTKMDHLENMFKESEEFFKAPVEIFVNNAGISTDFGWKKCMDVNIMAVMAATTMAMERMRGRSGCRIINIGSMAGLLTGFSEGATPYYVSKHGVVALSRTLAANKNEHGVDIMCLCPSFADTDIVNKVSAESRSVIAKALKRTGLLTVERVGEGFAALLACKNGTVMAVLCNQPFMVMPDMAMSNVIAMGIVAKMLRMVFGVDVMHPWHYILAVVVFMVILQLILRVLI